MRHSTGVFDPALSESRTIYLAHERDIVAARAAARELATAIGFGASDATAIITSVSEVARNVVEYAERGEIQIIADADDPSITVIASDEGPGIPDVQLALTDGYSTGNTLGLGLPGCRRLMDEFELVSVVGVGTTVTMKKRLRS